MVGRYHSYVLRAVLLALICDGTFTKPARADSGVIHQGKSTKVLGRTMGATFTAGTPENSSQVQTAVSLEVLGKSLQALQTAVTVPTEPTAFIDLDGATYTEVYSFGRRVFSQNLYYKSDGLLKASVGLAPIEVRVPIASYPVGPLTLQVAGGARAQAEIDGQIMPTISTPIEMSVIGVRLQGKATAVGFIEGYAKFFVMRGGVGGQLVLVEADADVQTQFFFDGSDPAVYPSAMVEFLKGRLYAFFDLFRIDTWRWSRMWNHDFYKWKGYCFATGAKACPSP